jgi:hypothetical protein
MNTDATTAAPVAPAATPNSLGHFKQVFTESGVFKQVHAQHGILL